MMDVILVSDETTRFNNSFPIRLLAISTLSMKKQPDRLENQGETL